MDDAVGCGDICGDDGGVVNHDAAVDDTDVDGGAVDGVGRLAIEGDGGCCVNSTSEHVVGQDGAKVRTRKEFFDGEAEGFECSGEGFVGGSEDGEWTVAGERVDKACLSYCCDQGGKGASANSNVNDGAWLIGHSFVGGHFLRCAVRDDAFSGFIAATRCGEHGQCQHRCQQFKKGCLHGDCSCNQRDGRYYARVRISGCTCNKV